MNLYAAFEAVAQAHASAKALRGPSGSLTYAQALSAAEHLSGYLAQSDGSKFAVLITGRKDCDTVLWQLAANRVGQVFVPLDAATPAERLAEIVRRTRPRFIVDDLENDLTHLGYQVHAVCDIRRLWVCEDARDYRDSPALSHIIFSSGSTGRPKAIWLPDSPLIEVVRQQAQRVGVSPASRYAWLLSPSFDASLSDIYVPLLAGATLHVCGFSMVNLKTLRAYFTKREITHADLSPSILPLLRPQDFPSLQCVVFGGELAQPDSIRAWHKAGKRMFNAYGPTETTICSSLCEVAEDWQVTDIGVPLNGVKYLVDKDGELIEPSPNMRGELCIGGAHRALGYDDPSLTSKRFVDSRFGPIYRTGDLVQVDERGAFHFLGRVDRQFKLHGVLICPEEVEAVARRLGCREALVKLKHKKLMLHYAGEIGPGPLRAGLQEHLPSTMVPTSYVHHEELPKLTSGKVKI